MPALPSFRTTQLGIPAALRHTGLITPTVFELLLSEVI